MYRKVHVCSEYNHMQSNFSCDNTLKAVSLSHHTQPKMSPQTNRLLVDGDIYKLILKPSQVMMAIDIRVKTDGEQIRQ